MPAINRAPSDTERDAEHAADDAHDERLAEHLADDAAALPAERLERAELAHAA